MEQTTHRQMSESFRLGAVLALTGGFLDAYTYLIRGGVFANAQTGNIVLLGVRLLRRRLRLCCWRADGKKEHEDSRGRGLCTLCV